MTRLQPTALLVLLLTLLVGRTANAQCDEQQPPWPAEAGAQHGSAVDVSGNVMVVGAPEHSQPGLGPAGAVTVARKAGGAWTSTQLPLPSLLTGGDRFGHAVAIDEAGETIVVGAPFNDFAQPDGGLVAVYTWQPVGQTWQLVAEWPGLFPAGLFGGAVDVSGDLIAVGEPVGAFGNGAVNVFRRTGPTSWAPDGFWSGATFLDGLGWAVAVDGNRLAIGTPFYDDVGFDRGRIEFHEHTGGAWTFVNAYPGDQDEAHFGSSVAMHGDNAVVGAPDRDFGGVDAGITYFFHWNGSFWSNTDGTGHGGTGQRFGAAVALQGSLAVVSSPRAPGAFGTPFGAEGGYATLFRWDGAHWKTDPYEAYSATDVAAGDHFGSALALDAPYLVSGAPFADGVGNDSGKAYVHDLSIGAQIVDHGNALAGSLGAPVLTGYGACCGHTTVGFLVSNAAPDAFAFFVVGLTPFFHAFKGGVMVPHPDVVYGPFLTSPAGDVPLVVFWPTGLPALSLWAQYWIADASGPLAYTATNGVEYISPGG